ncbi:MAG: TOBE domain-containing protein, partial [Mesorhizobium sp.]
SEVQIIARTAGGEDIVANFRERHSFAPGETIRLSAEPGPIHLFHGETGKRIETAR